MKFPRASGVLLHPTSLPSKFGIGDFGDEAYKFVDFLVESKQTYWQVLPLGQTGYGDSPYQCFSAFAGNIYLISPERLIKDGFLSDEDLQSAPEFPEGKVDFGKMLDFKLPLLKKAFEAFRATSDDSTIEAFHKFCRENSYWLEDYALFRAIKFDQDQKSWQEWDADLKLRKPEALENAKKELDDEVFAQKFYQFAFFRQWDELKNYANEHDVRIVGDVPIFIALDSADVWCNPQEFKLNKDGSPTVVAGVPPDYFSATGQLWGNPIYNWDSMRENGFRWWIARIYATLQLFDVVRVDHFRGFAAAWEVPGGDKTAVNGEWVNVPGKELFTAIRDALGKLPFWAEDLGVITLDVEELRDGFEFPGMRILQFAFGGGAGNLDLPHNYIQNSVAYTGTHDNDTIVGWFHSHSGEGSTRDDSSIRREQNYCMQYLNTDGKEIHWDLIRAVWSSIADSAVAPMQDLLGLGNDARMNLPASTSGNWYWQARKGDFSNETAARLRELTEIYGRN